MQIFETATVDEILVDYEGEGGMEEIVLRQDDVCTLHGGRVKRSTP